MSQTDELLTVEEAASVLGISVSTMYNRRLAVVPLWRGSAVAAWSTRVASSTRS
jgi:hypothetical protein